MSVTANLTTNVETITATIVVEDETIIAEINTAARGPAGPAGGGTGSIDSTTTSNGTANLDLLNVTTATATVSGTLTADHIHGNLAGNVYGHVRAGENLAKGDPVYVSGSHGSGSTLIPIVSKADASNAAKMPAVGVMDAAVTFANNGHMVIVGTITELDTNAYTVNAELYVAAGGGMTATPPTARAQPVARVERANINNGAVIVKVNGLSASDATASTLVRRDSSGGANFAGTVNLATGVISDLQFEDYQAAADATFLYGTNSASAHRIALGAGTTGAALFGAADAAAARTTLGLSLPIAVASGGTGNTNGSAATLTTPRTIGGSSFDGSANVTSFPSPGAIGATTASTGRFTTLTATSSGFIGTQAFTDASATLILSRVASATATRLDIVGNNTYQDVLFIKTDVVSGTGTNWGFGQRADTFFGNTSGSFQIVGAAYVAGVEQSQYRVPLIAQPNGTLVLNGATANAISANVLVGTTTDPGTGKLHVAGSISSTGTISTTSATASTSTTTGALVVSGGVGIAGAVNSLYQRVGSGTPEGVVTAPVGAVFHRTDGGAGTSFYVKESGAGNTGWVAK